MMGGDLGEIKTCPDCYEKRKAEEEESKNENRT